MRRCVLFLSEISLLGETSCRVKGISIMEPFHHKVSVMTVNLGQQEKCFKVFIFLACIIKMECKVYVESIRK